MKNIRYHQEYETESTVEEPVYVNVPTVKEELMFFEGEPEFKLETSSFEMDSQNSDGTVQENEFRNEYLRADCSSNIELNSGVTDKVPASNLNDYDLNKVKDETIEIKLEKFTYDKTCSEVEDTDAFLGTISDSILPNTYFDVQSGHDVSNNVQATAERENDICSSITESKRYNSHAFVPASNLNDYDLNKVKDETIGIKLEKFTYDETCSEIKDTDAFLETSESILPNTYFDIQSGHDVQATAERKNDICSSIVESKRYYSHEFAMQQLSQKPKKRKPTSAAKRMKEYRQKLSPRTRERIRNEAKEKMRIYRAEKKLKARLLLLTPQVKPEKMNYNIDFISNKEQIFHENSSKLMPTSLLEQTHDMVIHDSNPALKYFLKCDLCEEKFSCWSSLTSHMTTHDSEIEFKCDVCSRTFSYKSSLIRHKLNRKTCCVLHKWCACDICRKRFTARRYLERHIKKHHKLDSS